MADLILYGLKSCDACRKALKSLEAVGTPARFVDLREETDLTAKVPQWLDQLGTAKLINKRSTTWRTLSEKDKAAADGAGVADLLIAHPTLIKRPIIEDGRTARIGV